MVAVGIRIAFDIFGKRGEKERLVKIWRGGERLEVEDGCEDCADYECKESDCQESTVADEDAELVGKEAEMILHCSSGRWLCVGNVKGFTIWAHWIPHAHH